MLGVIIARVDELKGPRRDVPQVGRVPRANGPLLVAGRNDRVHTMSRAFSTDSGTYSFPYTVIPEIPVRILPLPLVLVVVSFSWRISSVMKRLRPIPQADAYRCDPVLRYFGKYLDLKGFDPLLVEL